MTGRSRHEVLGLVCDFWSWAGTESDDGHISGVYLSNLPEMLGADEVFWAALAVVGWVGEDGSGIVVPGWDAWLCESAKKRKKDARRKRNERFDAPEEAPKQAPKTSAKRPQNVRNVSAKSPPTEQDSTEQKEEVPTEPRDAPTKPKESNSPHSRCVAFFCDSWRDKYGDKYPFDGGKDGSTVRDILKHLGGSEDRFREVVGRYLSDPDPFAAGKRHPLGILRSQLPTWMGDRPPPATLPFRGPATKRTAADVVAEMRAKRLAEESAQLNTEATGT